MFRIVAYSLYERWGAHDLTRATRGGLVRWLTWNDPNGEYVVGERYADGEPAPTTADYRALALAQWQDGQPVASQVEGR